MEIARAQRDVRRTFVGGFFGQLVSGALWLGSAATATWASETAAIVVLCLGGTLVYPLTTACLWLSGRPAALPAGHPLASLAMQVAFTVPPGLLVALAAASAERDWFFPASMVIVGSHYLPFVFLYGMRLFAALAGTLVLSGVVLGVMVAEPFSAGGWFAGALLVVFAFLLRRHADDDQERTHSGGASGSGTPPGPALSTRGPTVGSRDRAGSRSRAAARLGAAPAQRRRRRRLRQTARRASAQTLLRCFPGPP